MQGSAKQRQLSTFLKRVEVKGNYQICRFNTNFKSVVEAEMKKNLKQLV